MEIRELTDHDLTALLALCQTALPYDTFSMPLLRRRTLGDPEYHQPYQLWASDGARMIGALIGIRRASETGKAGGLLLLAVTPEARRGGIATALIDELERRMRADGITTIYAGGTTPNFFWAGVDMRYTPAYCLLLKHGYHVSDIRVNERVDLSAQSWDTRADEDRLAPEGFTIRRLEPGERATFSSYMTERWSRGWHDEAMNSYLNDPITTFVALQHGSLCAFATCDSEGFAGHFGPTGTNEELRGKGIGRILFYRCMRDLYERGLTHAEIVWVGPIPFYTRIAGAYVHRAFWAMQKDF